MTMRPTPCMLLAWDLLVRHLTSQVPAKLVYDAQASRHNKQHAAGLMEARTPGGRPLAMDRALRRTGQLRSWCRPRGPSGSVPPCRMLLLPPAQSCSCPGSASCALQQAQGSERVAEILHW